MGALTFFKGDLVLRKCNGILTNILIGYKQINY